jgi:predicted thioesterase
VSPDHVQQGMEPERPHECMILIHDNGPSLSAISMGIKPYSPVAVIPSGAGIQWHFTDEPGLTWCRLVREARCEGFPARDDANQRSTHADAVSVGLETPFPQTDAVSVGDTTRLRHADAVSVGDTTRLRHADAVSVGDTTRLGHADTVSVGDTTRLGHADAVSVGDTTRLGHADAVSVGDTTRLGHADTTSGGVLSRRFCASMRG